MNEEYSTRVRLRSLFIISLSFLILFVPVYLFFAVSGQLNKYQPEIQKALAKQLGLPISFAKIKTDWEGITLGITIEGVEITESRVPIMIQKVFVAPRYYELLFKQVLKWERVELVGLKATLTSSTLPELNAGSLNPLVFTALQTLLKLDSLFVFKEAEVTWIEQDIKIKHWLSGKLQAKDIANTPEFGTMSGFVFKGTHSFQFAEGNKIPAFDSKIEFKPGANRLTIEMANDQLKAEAAILLQNAETVTSQGRLTMHNLEIKEVDLYFPPDAYSIPWITWLKNAVQTGTIAAGKVNFQGLNKNFTWDGEVFFENLNLNYDNDWEELKNASGKIKITTNTVWVELKEGHIYEVPIMALSAVIDGIGAPHQDPVLRIEGQLKTQFETLVSFLQQSPLRNTLDEAMTALLDKLTGKAAWTVFLKIPLAEITTAQAIEWTLSSSMQGIKIDLPAPIGKTAMDSRPTTVTGFPLKADEQGMQLTMAGILDAKWVFSNHEQATLKRGNVVLGGRGQSTWVKEEKLYILGSIPVLNIEDWLGVFKNTASYADIPIEMQLYTKQMDAFGIIFQDTELLHVTEEPTTWRIKGPLAKGILKLPSATEKKYQFAFAYLKLNSENRASPVLSDLLDPEERVPLDFACQELHFNNIRFGQVSVTLIPTSHHYEIKNLKIITPNFEISGMGEWHLNKPYTVLKGQIVASNIGATLREFGFPAAIQGAKGVIRYDFKWPESPLAFKVTKVKGELSVRGEQGSLMGVEQGLGRVMGLLNNPLNFPSVLKKGFEFNNLRGTFALQEGYVETRNFSIAGNALQIEIEGTTHLDNKALDLKMFVTPKMMGVGTLGAAITPVVPFLGVPIMVFDKLTGSRVAGSIQYKYQVGGTWDSPRVETLGEAKGN
jgi:uncharacterized protein YhdP